MDINYKIDDLDNRIKMASNNYYKVMVSPKSNDIKNFTVDNFRQYNNLSPINNRRFADINSDSFNNLYDYNINDKYNLKDNNNNEINSNDFNINPILEKRKEKQYKNFSKYQI